jgi:hypothetical protein
MGPAPSLENPMAKFYEVYRGYELTCSLHLGIWYVTKDGRIVASEPSIEAARAEVDAIELPEEPCS